MTINIQYFRRNVAGLLLGIKDGYTALHCQNVARLAAEIGRVLYFEPEIILDLEMAGLLHDIGKLMIPKQILTKPGSLTMEEKALINTHPAIGAKMARQVRTTDRIVQAILTHHERLDGSGYPNRLSGNQLDYLGQMIAVADVFDAMVTDRPYREALPKNVALDFLSNADKFDESIFKALNRVVDSSI